MKVLAKEQFKSIIVKAINENLGDSYGHWIGPDAKIFDVSHSHRNTAIQVIKFLMLNHKMSKEEFDRLNVENTSIPQLEEILFRNGWLRGVRDDIHDYYVNGKIHQQPTSKQIQWLKDYGLELNRNVIFLPKGNTANQKGVKFIHDVDGILESISKPTINPQHEKMAKFLISNVWRYMPKEDRFSPYQFSLWMDSETHLSSMKSRMAKEIYPTDDDAESTFFEKIITPTLEKLEQKYYEKTTKKMDKEDPLFILKSVVQNKTYEGAKRTLYRNHLNSSWQRTGKISDEDVNQLFKRLYLVAMGETMYDENHMKDSPYLSDLRKPSPTGDKSEELFIQYFAGWNSEKFPDMVKVWRGTNSPLHKIRAGDFVTLDKDYAYAYITGKFGAVVSSELPSKDLKVYKMDIDSSGLVYWPQGHSIQNFTGSIPTFRQFWEEFK